MRVLVTGAGRGGTNLATELIRNSGQFNFTSNVEDRRFFEHNSLPQKYATKLATENKGFTKENIKRMLNQNPDLFIVFIIRNPIDNCLSKIVRGQPKSKGGDSTVEQVASDGTLEGSISALKITHKMFKFLHNNYKKRLLFFTMEDLLINTSEIVDMVAESLEIEGDAKERMNNFYKTNRNAYQNKRYGKNKVMNVDLYKDLETNFNGFFKNKREYVDKIRDEFKQELSFFSYE